MSRIVILVTQESLDTPILSALSELLNSSVMQVHKAVTEKRPILEMEIFDNQYEKKADLIRRLIDRIRRSNIRVEVYELLGDEVFKADNAPHGSLISVDVLENILGSADEDVGHP